MNHMDQIAELREGRGLTQGQIAQRLGISKGSVSYHCLMHGIEHPTKRPRTFVKPGAVERRGNHLVRRFTPEEDEQMQALALAGHGNAEIGRRMNRTSNSIKSCLATLARRQERGTM